MLFLFLLVLVAHIAFAWAWFYWVLHLPESKRDQAYRAVWPRVVSTLFLLLGVFQALTLVRSRSDQTSSADEQDVPQLREVGEPESKHTAKR